MGVVLKDFLAFLLLAGLVTAAASAAAWWWSEPRRLRRALWRALGERPGAVLVGFGGAAALAKEGHRAAFVGAGGARAVGMDRLFAVELIADGEVLGRSCRDQARRPLDRAPPESQELVLRFVFDDARDPDAQVVFWRAGSTAPLSEAVDAARRWLSRGDALMRHRAAPRVSAPAADWE
jgi:hypothetical protein